MIFGLMMGGGMGCQSECLNSGVPPDLNVCLNTNGGGPSSEETVPNFSLRDVNPNSLRFDQLVSPRDYEGQISAWYFGHST